jgi:hypothetical protein
MSTETTAFQFTIPLTAEQAQEAVGLIDQYDRTVGEEDDLDWGNDSLLECFRAGQKSCLTAAVTSKGLLITYDHEADLEVAQTMTESLLGRFGIDKPVIFRYGKTTSMGRESSGGAILAHRDSSKSQWSSARDLEDLMNAGVDVAKLLSDALWLRGQNKSVPDLRDASSLLERIATRMTEDEFRREKAIEKEVETEEDAAQLGNAISFGFEYFEGRTIDADDDIELARKVVGVTAEVTPNLDEADEDEPEDPAPNM